MTRAKDVGAVIFSLVSTICIAMSVYVINTMQNAESVTKMLLTISMVSLIIVKLFYNEKKLRFAFICALLLNALALLIVF